MSNYVEYQDKIAFHPSYYITEIIEETGLTQYGFAKRLGITPEDFSRLMNGEQDLTPDIAMKLAQMLGTSVEYWLNLQSAYDAMGEMRVLKKSKSFIATPPGASIKEQLEMRGMSLKEFAFRMGLPEKHVSRLINGDVQLTKETACQLEMVLGLPSHFWINLEAIYREKLAKVKAENAAEFSLIINGLRLDK